ncbi:MAG: cytochrome c peroxidase [Chitinophagaceae bacterium]
MKRFLAIICIVIFFLAGIAWINVANKPTPLKFIVPAGWPQPLYDFKKNPLTKEGFELGRKLFYDEKLSKDSTISCASCHQQFSGFATYDHNLSHGYNNTLTTRNAPALQNLAWQKEFMWDGGIAHLDLQPLAPLTATNEMGETIGNVIKKISADTAYKRMFKAAFGTPLINTQRMNMAISQFVLMLVSSNSKYDKVMRGEAEFALAEKLGYDIFKLKCMSCHAPPFFSDFSYRNTGLPVDTTLNDYGRMKITNNKNDSLRFKVPSLRNIATTAPYGHDGRFFSLQNVYEHYRNKIVITPLTDSLLQHKLPISNYESGQLTAFLRTLTDTTFLKNPAFAPPGYDITPFFIHYH